MNIKVTILGSGTSTGVPVIGCDCAVCKSDSAANKRTRSSVLITVDGKNILIDTSTDLRAQSISNNLKILDAVLYTHTHADHTHGIDDLRSFNMHKEGPIPCYGSPETIERITEAFDYIFAGNKKGGWRPNLTVTSVSAPFEISGTVVTPVPARHGANSVYGYRIGPLAYLTDCSGVPSESMELLQGIELLIIGALRKEPHPSHFSITEAIELGKTLNAGKIVLTHLGHKIDHSECSKELPEGVMLATDGLVLEL